MGAAAARSESTDVIEHDDRAARAVTGLERQIAEKTRDVGPETAHFVLVLSPESVRVERRAELVASYRENGVHSLADRLMKKTRIGSIAILCDFEGATAVHFVSYRALVALLRRGSEAA